VKRITIKGEAETSAVRFIEALTVEIDGQEYVIEDDENGREWFDANGDQIADPTETAEEEDAVDKARWDYWGAYQDAAEELNLDAIKDECHRRAAAAVADGVEVAA